MLDTEEYLKFLGAFPQTGAGYEYVRFLYDKTMELKPNLILELGAGVAEAFGFVSTRTFLLALRDLGKGLLISVDNLIIKPERAGSEELKQFWIALTIDDVILGNCWTWGRIDLLYIDTSHTYTHTLQELTLFSPYLTERGMIILNDTRYRSEVVKAVEDFMKEHQGEWSFTDHSCLDNTGKDFGMGEMKRNG